MTETGIYSIVNVNSGDIRDGEGETTKGHEVNGSVIEAPLEMINDGKETGVDIDEWAGTLASMLDNVPGHMFIPGHPGRIARIPQNLLEVDPKAYEPCFLAIGPYHNVNPRAQYMEMKKRIVLKFALEKRPEITLRDYLLAIKSVEPRARDFYSDINMETENFVQIMLLDSLYLITVFCGLGGTTEPINRDTNTHEPEINEDIRNTNDSDQTTRIITRVDDSNNQTGRQENHSSQPSWFWLLLSHDLFLIENQLPFFVLEKMYNLTHGGSRTQLLVIMKDAFVRLLSVYRTPDSEMVISSTEEVHHLLHLCHMFFRPTIQQESFNCEAQESCQMFKLGSALQLYEQGVRFTVRPTSTNHSLLDITFSSSGDLLMPFLHVEDNTLSLLRNLIALEQMKYPSLGLDVSAYAVFLLHLITIPEDVMLLRGTGIIQHHLASDKEMVYLINRLNVGLSFDYIEDKYQLKPVFHELKRYSERKSRRWTAWLKHRYFSDPLTTIYVVAASLLLVLAFVQTYYTMCSYYRSLIP